MGVLPGSAVNVDHSCGADGCKSIGTLQTYWYIGKSGCKAGVYPSQWISLGYNNDTTFTIDKASTDILSKKKVICSNIDSDTFEVSTALQCLSAKTIWAGFGMPQITEANTSGDNFDAVLISSNHTFGVDDIIRLDGVDFQYVHVLATSTTNVTDQAFTVIENDCGLNYIQLPLGATSIVVKSDDLATTYTEGVEYKVNNACKKVEFTTSLTDVAVSYTNRAIFEEGVDYELDPVSGIVKRLVTGTISAGATVHIDALGYHLKGFLFGGGDASSFTEVYLRMVLTRSTDPQDEPIAVINIPRFQVQPSDTLSFDTTDNTTIPFSGKSLDPGYPSGKTYFVFMKDDGSLQEIKDAIPGIVC